MEHYMLEEKNKKTKKQKTDLWVGSLTSSSYTIYGAFRAFKCAIGHVKMFIYIYTLGEG